MCEKRNCGCNKPGNAVICYTNTPIQPCIGVNLTVNNTESFDGSTDTSMILEETNNISAYKEHLEFVNSPEPLSGLKRNVVLRLTQAFLTSISNLFKGRNVGVGASIYKGSSTVGPDTFQDFKRLRDSDSIKFTETLFDIKADVDQEWLEDQFPEIPTVDYPVIDGVSVGTGIPIYSGLENKKINISSLYSPNGSVLITKDTNPLSPTFNRVHIEIPNFDYIKSFYVNSNYTGGDADGSVIKPFPNFEVARTAFIGTGNILQPQFAGAKIILQTSSVTAESPTTNTLTIEFQNNSILTYIGTNVYDIDSEILFNLLANETYPGLSLGVNGELPFPIYMSLIGNGTIARTNGLGLVRWFGSKRNPLNLNYYFSRLTIGETSSDSISFGEWGNNPSIYTEDIESANGTKLEDVYGFPFKATTALLPTTPLFDIEFPNHSSTPTLFVFGSTIISSISQSHLKIDKNASIIIQDGGELYFNNIPHRISYSGVMGENYGNYKTYLPYSDKVMIDFIEGNLYGTIRSEEPAGFGISGWGSMFRMHPGASFGGNIQIDIQTNNFSNEIFKLVGNTNIITSGGAESKIQTPNVRNFINADGNTALVNVTMPNTTIFVRYAPMINTSNYSLNTLGSLSSINSKPILTGYPTHPNLAAAQAAEVKGTMYYDTGIDALATVI